MPERVAISSSRGSPWPRDRTQVSHITGGLFTVWATREVCFIVIHHFGDGKIEAKREYEASPGHAALVLHPYGLIPERLF